MSKKLALYFLLFTVGFVYLWNFYFGSNEFISVLGSSLFPVIVGLVSLFLVYKAYRVHGGKEKSVWLLFAIGLVLHVLGNVIWLINVMADTNYQPNDPSYLLWLMAYLLFLSALIYKVRLIHSTILSNPYFFNSIILIIVLSAIFIHYLVGPYLESAESPFQIIVIGVFYPAVDIGILFITTLLYYLYRQRQDRTVIFFFMGAFYLQIFADMIAAIMKTNKDYQVLMVEPLWVGSLLLIGFAGLFSQGAKQDVLKVELTIYEKESRFSYVSVVILMILTYQSIQWQINALSVALALVFFMIIRRQLIIIRKNKKLMLEYRELAYQDSLTGLLNRSSFKLDLEKAIQNSGTSTILLIDLDRFKMINDTLGHIVGDQILIQSAIRLRNSIPVSCRIYRLGGDEFVVLAEETTREDCVSLAEQILMAFSNTFSINQHEITITPSIGISSFPFNGQDSETLFKAADAAMYLAKAKGRNNFQFFSSTLNQVLIRKMTVENELRKAISQNELELYYQPKIALHTGEVIGMEALLRWNSRELGPVPPSEFIPIAEDTGLIISIGEWVLKTACLQNKRWQNQGYRPLCVSVNVSVQQFGSSNLVNTVKNVLKETGLQSKYLELEITESIMQNVEESKRVLTRLWALGIKIALDDFGTGYSSLHVLKVLPINTLKIDKSFIDDITSEKDHSMVKGIIDIARNLKLDIVAEGIEKEYQLKTLTDYQCNYGQGYYFSKPLSAFEFEQTYLC